MENDSPASGFNPPPPPLITPAPRRQPRKSRGWMITAMVLLVLLIVSVVANLGSFVSNLVRLEPGSAPGGGPRLEEVVLQDNSSHNKIAVVEVEGIITDMLEHGGVTFGELLKAQLKRAKEDERVKAVLLKVNSPGGEVLASDEIYNALANFQEKSSKPVVCSMGSLAASGGYYVSAPCRWIVANELTITGSIGVIMSTINYRALMDKVGVRPIVFKSGKFKDMLSSSKELSEITPEEKQMVQNLIDETFSKFKRVVGQGRDKAFKENGKDGHKLSANWEDYADGRVLSGSEALKLGFVDELGDFDAAVERVKKIVGIPRANLVQYQQRIEFSDLFRFLGQSDAKGVKLDLGFDMPRLKAGELYFLLPTVLP